MLLAVVSCCLHRPSYLPQHLALEHSQPVFSLNARDQVSHPYQTAGKVMVLYIRFCFTYVSIVRVEHFVTHL